jgi:phosphoglycolate phosphatase-like HAD superfamily hydrolase
MKLVMFDVDGTLTDTFASDEDGFARAIGDVLGIAEINTDWNSYPEVTSGAVLDAIVRGKLGRGVSRDECRAVQRRLVERLDGKINEIPGAAAFLRTLRAAGFGVALASGDWEFTARHKLAAAGVPADNLPAAFCEAGDGRTAIMRRSLQLALPHYRCGRFEKIIYVGDGAWDLRAAQELGWKFIGIGGGRRAAALNSAGARHVFPDYRRGGDLLAAIDSPTA